MFTADDEYFILLSRTQSRGHIREEENKIFVAVIFLVELWDCAACVFLFVYASGSPVSVDLSSHVRVRRSKRTNARVVEITIHNTSRALYSERAEIHLSCQLPAPLVCSSAFSFIRLLSSFQLN